MLRFLLILILVAAVLVIRFLPWYVSVGLFLLLILAGKYILRQIFLMPFKAKGKVLSGATIQLHGIAPASAPPVEKDPEDEDDTEEPEEPEEPPEELYDHFSIDVTITPKAPAGTFRHWEPGELLLVRPDSTNIDDDEEGHVEGVEVFREGAFTKDEDYKYEGPQRLRLLVGVNKGQKRLKFRYYFESFGALQLP